MHVAIDGDQMCYACGFATEGEELSHTLHNVKAAIERILKDTKSETYDLFISGSSNYREDVAVSHEYKGTRTGKKPSSYEDIREYLKGVWNAKESDGIESDDEVSLLLWEDFIAACQQPEDCKVILSSPDKDLNNTPGWHYNPRTQETYWVDERQATRHFCWQMLCGDGVDNIKGLPKLTISGTSALGLKAGIGKKGVGKVTAKQITNVDMDAYQTIVNMFVAYLAWGFDEGLSEEQVEEYAREQYHLLWMLREREPSSSMWPCYEAGLVEAKTKFKESRYE